MHGGGKSEEKAFSYLSWWLGGFLGKLGVERGGDEEDNG